LEAKIVAVDEDLKGLREAIASQGYEVVSLNERDIDKADAVVVSGIEDDLMNIQDIKTKAPVINAVGKTSEEIVKGLQDLFRQVH